MKIRCPPRPGVLVDFQNVPADLWFVLREDPTFGPVKYVKEVSHVKHMYADLLLVHPKFSSKLMITRGNPLLIRFQTDRKLNFGPVRTNEGG